MSTIVPIEKKNLASLQQQLQTDLAKASTPAEEQTIYSVHLQSVDECLKDAQSQVSHYRKFREEVKTTLNQHHKDNPDIHLAILGAPDSHFINLDGSNDYLEMYDVPAGVLDFTSSWAVGIELENVSSINDSSYTTLFSRGTNKITLRKGGSNWGVYFYANNNSVAQANTWVSPMPGSKVLFTCNGSQVKYYLNGTLRSTTTLNANVSHNNASGNLHYGKGFGNSGFWYGGINNMLIMTDPTALGTNQLQEYFGSKDVSKMSFYANDVVDYLPLGERQYNSLLGTKGVISGALHNSSPSGFEART
jgi:hypothetical protein